jgi:ribosomal protein S18 acetylase RimI-like enzyme
VVAIERIQADTWERARTVRLRALQDAPDAFWTTADEEVATTADQWRERVSSSDSATFVAGRDGVDVGLVVGAPHHEHQGDAGLYALWVAPDARGDGAATELVEAVVDWARAAGYHTLRLDVADTNGNALRLYQRMGFQPTGAVSAFSSPRDHITEHERALDLRPADPPV